MMSVLAEHKMIMKMNVVRKVVPVKQVKKSTQKWRNSVAQKLGVASWPV